jgi:hypothetical protein
MRNNRGVHRTRTRTNNALYVDTIVLENAVQYAPSERSMRAAPLQRYVYFLSPSHRKPLNAMKSFLRR